MSQYLARRIESNPRIHVHTGMSVKKILGDDHVRGAELGRDGAKSETIPCGAVFVFIGAEPHTQWPPEQVARNEDGYLLTGRHASESGRWPLDREPCDLETTLPRLLAAGDVRAGATKRVVFAVGDGALAATCVHDLLSLLK